jgi:hypothetical protein
MLLFLGGCIDGNGRRKLVARQWNWLPARPSRRNANRQDSLDHGAGGKVGASDALLLSMG